MHHLLRLENTKSHSQFFSEEAFDGTRLRDIIPLTVTINEFHDIQLTLDPFVESAVNTTAPGRTVRFIPI